MISTYFAATGMQRSDNGERVSNRQGKRLGALR